MINKRNRRLTEKIFDAPLRKPTSRALPFEKGRVGERESGRESGGGEGGRWYREKVFLITCAARYRRVLSFSLLSPSSHPALQPKVNVTEGRYQRSKFTDEPLIFRYLFA